MTATPDTALARCYQQARSGPAFEPGHCKQETREVYSVPSDGSKSAAIGWLRTDHRLNVAGDKAPRGSLLWWTGGSNGYGHVAIADGEGWVWTVDAVKPGYWGRVPFGWFATHWPALDFAGVSADIDGVQVYSTTGAQIVSPRATATTDQRVARFTNELNEDRVVDLDLLDEIIKHGTPTRLALAAKAAKWACINAARTVIAAAGPAKR